MRRTKSDQLLIEFLERISWRVLEDYRGIVSKMIHRRAGVYALYKRDQLYYVGLASNLMGRIKHHLKDRHSLHWDRFSVYITHRDQHVKQLESLLLRIARPDGNRVEGGFGGSANLYRRLASEMSNLDADRRAAALGERAVRKRRRARTATAKGTLSLAGLVERRVPLRARYKRKQFKATLRRDGYIGFGGHLYDSPSAAARRVVKRGVNGWQFWCYRDGRDWRPLADLRK